MVTAELVYQHDKTTLSGFLAQQQGDIPRPAVMICHAWKGRDQYVCDKAVELANLGYIGFAIDVYGKGVLGTNPEENTRLMTPFIEDRDFLRQRLLAGYEEMCKLRQVDQDRIAVIGYCFGGLCALDLMRTGTKLQGIVSFHGLLKPLGTGDNVTQTSTKALVLHGGSDPMVGLDDVIALNAEMQKMQADWQLHVYSSAQHSFTNPAANDPKLGTVYHKRAADHANFLLKRFLREVFAVPEWRPTNA